MKNDFKYKWSRLFASKRYNTNDGVIKLTPEEQQELLNDSESFKNNELSVLGTDNVVGVTPELTEALYHATSAIYLNDNSDFLSSLYGVVESLTGIKGPSEEQIKDIFRKTHNEIHNE